MERKRIVLVATAFLLSSVLLMATAQQKEESTISISVSPTTIERGPPGTPSTITISGEIDPVRVGVTVKVQWRHDAGSWTIAGSATTDSNGRYSLEDEREPLHGWETMEYKASWEGDENTLGAESDAATVTVIQPTPGPGDGLAGPTVSPYLLVAIAAVVAVAAVALYFVKARKPKPAAEYERL